MTQQAKTITMSEIMTPNMANFSGNVHGGYILSFLDKAAYACASRYAGTTIVTLSVDSVYFKEPVHVGDLITCYASINYVGTSSMEVGLKIVAEDLKTGEKRHTNSCYFTMVALDENKKPTKLPPLILNNELEERRYKEAQLRRTNRLKLYQDHLKRKK
jgi:acyl-CoA hydrolase